MSFLWRAEPEVILQVAHAIYIEKASADPSTPSRILSLCEGNALVAEDDKFIFVANTWNRKTLRLHEGRGRSR
jgi:hypothetical protein